MAKITPANGAEAVFYEVHELHFVGGVEKRHRNADFAFPTREEAETWIERQSE